MTKTNITSKEYLAVVLVLLCFITSFIDSNFHKIAVQECSLPLIAAAAVGAGSSLLGGLFGNAARKRAQRKVDQAYQEQINELQAETTANELDRADSRAAIRQVEEYNKEREKALGNTAIKRGMTDEAKVAYSARLNRNVGDVVSNIAAQGSQRKDAARSNLRQTKMSRAMAQANAANAQADGIGNMVSGIAQSAGQIAQAYLSAPTSTASTSSQPTVAIGDNVRQAAAAGRGLYNPTQSRRLF